MFFRNVGWFSTNYSALYPQNRTLHKHIRENLKSHTGEIAGRDCEKKKVWANE
jgi:hypothetical protein